MIARLPGGEAGGRLAAAVTREVEQRIGAGRHPPMRSSRRSSTPRGRPRPGPRLIDLDELAAFSRLPGPGGLLSTSTITTSAGSSPRRSPVVPVLARRSCRPRARSAVPGLGGQRRSRSRRRGRLPDPAQRLPRCRASAPDRRSTRRGCPTGQVAPRRRSDPRSRRRAQQHPAVGVAQPVRRDANATRSPIPDRGHGGIGQIRRRGVAQHTRRSPGTSESSASPRSSPRSAIGQARATISSPASSIGASPTCRISTNSGLSAPPSLPAGSGCSSAICSAIRGERHTGRQRGLPGLAHVRRRSGAAGTRGRGGGSSTEPPAEVLPRSRGGICHPLVPGAPVSLVAAVVVVGSPPGGSKGTQAINKERGRARVRMRPGSHPEPRRCVAAERLPIAAALPVPGIRPSPARCCAIPNA
jgi:hypothetical protein